MEEASQKKRALAQHCRELAALADDRTAANLRMLADEYEAEADELDRAPGPEPPMPSEG